MQDKSVEEFKLRHFKCNMERFYMYATENIRGYNRFVTYRNKRLLTVCGSGDQAFNAILHNCQDITIFDINRVALYHFYLKKAAIEVLDYEEFINFYKNKMPYSGYLKFKSKIPKKVQLFFDSLYENEENLYEYTCLYPDTMLMAFNEYTEKNNYEILKKRLSSVNFEVFEADIDILPSLLKGKYQVILLSNIYDYYDSENIEEYRKKVLKMLSPYLDNHYQILLTYSYDQFYTDEISNEDMRYIYEIEQPLSVVKHGAYIYQK